MRDNFRFWPKTVESGLQGSAFGKKEKSGIVVVRGLKQLTNHVITVKSSAGSESVRSGKTDSQRSLTINGCSNFFDFALKIKLVN